MAEEWSIGITKSFLNSGLSGPEKLVFIGLLLHADKDLKAWPSQASLARYASTSKVSIYKYIDSLEAKGLIKIKKELGKNNVYEINKKWKNIITPEHQLKNLTGKEFLPDKNFTYPSKDFYLAPGKNFISNYIPITISLNNSPNIPDQSKILPGTVNEENQNKESEPEIQQTQLFETGGGVLEKPRPKEPVKNAQFLAEFEEWYKGYPLKKSRKEAVSRFVSLRKSGVSLADLTTARDNYAKERTGKDHTFTLYPSTFLGPRERWREYLCPVNEVKQRGMMEPVSADSYAFESFLMQEVFENDEWKYHDWLKAGKPNRDEYYARYQRRHRTDR